MKKMRSTLFSAASIAMLALSIIIVGAGYLAQTKFEIFKGDFFAAVLSGTLIAFTNQDRAAAGVGAITADPLLAQAAQAAANDMATKGYFSHVSPDGKTPWYWLAKVGYTYRYAGQNLAVNFDNSETVQTAWMNSPSHRANIEKPHYTKIGIGIANGMYKGKQTTFVVEFFAAP